MKVRLGSFTITIDVDASNPNILELPLKEVLTSLGVTIKSGDIDISAEPKERLTTVAVKRNNLQTKSDITPASPADAVEALKRADISDKTIVSIAKRIFHQHGVTQANFPQLFNNLETAAQKFLTRPITEDIWAIYAAPVELKGERPKICVMGLNKENQLIVIALEEGTPSKVFERVIKRGLNPKQISLGILSFELNATDVFKETFTKALVQLDWNEYIDLSTGAETKLRLKNAMNSAKQKDVEKLIDQIEAPQELLTYLDYPKNIQRAIKTTNPIRRLNQDVNQRLRRVNHAQHDTVLIWSILRLQFQWLRIPVDSEQLSTLSYIKNPSLTIQE